MSKVSQWQKILGRTAKPKSPVLVGGKSAEMTDTQAYRFSELKTSNGQVSQAANADPFGQSKCSLEEAAFRLMISEDDVLQRAAAGSINLYTSATGLAGRWRRVDENGQVIESSSRILRSGYLALTVHSCRELTLSKGVNVLVFEMPIHADTSPLNFDAETLQELSAWGSEKKCFCVREPHWVDHDSIVLLPS